MINSIQLRAWPQKRGSWVAGHSPRVPLSSSVLIAACVLMLTLPSRPVLAGGTQTIGSGLLVAQAAPIRALQQMPLDVVIGQLPKEPVEKKQEAGAADPKAKPAAAGGAGKGNDKPVDPILTPTGDGRLIENFFRGLFGRPPVPTGNPDPGANPGDNKSAVSRDRDHIDNRAPRDPKVEALMREAGNAAGKGDWKNAVEMLQRLLDQPEDSLYRLPSGRWQSIRRTANRMLGAAPKDVLDAYRTENAGLSDQLLREARRSGKVSDYARVTTRFFHTPAGYAAANYLANQHFDRGEFGMAADWFQDLAESPIEFTKTDAWRMKALLAAREAGNSEFYERLLKQLKPTSESRVTLGTQQVDPVDWLNSFPIVANSGSVMLSDWTQLYGTASRIGTVSGGDPLLVPLWSIPLTGSHLVRRRVAEITQDLGDQNRVPLLTSMPLVTGGRALYRDLRGVRCVDLESGRTIWESVEGVSPERIVTGLPTQQLDRHMEGPFFGRPRFGVPFQGEMAEYQGSSVEYHPLANLLFRDGTYGQISSDGNLVFVLEDHGILSRYQPGQQWGWDGNENQNDQYGIPWKTNRLAAYDLKTGRPVWSAGGVETKESFDLPLAGSYFYGVPAVDGDELLVVAGKSDEIKLCSLNRATGKPNWTKLIAFSDTKIEQDIGRRWYTAQVAAGGGIVVCPTTVGWLVAVDRLQQTVLWAHRYQPQSSARDREPGTQYVPQRDLTQLWAPSAPILSQGVVVFTPPEDAMVLALSAADGKPLWEKPKADWVYLSGVFENRVVLVGRTEITALELSTGKPLWTESFGDAGRPTGRGLAVGNHYYLPLSSGELRTIDLTTGKTAFRSGVSSTQFPLGNLAMHRGKFLSLTPRALTCFDQRDAVLRNIQARLMADARDPIGLLRDAEMKLLDREYTASVERLNRVDTTKLTDDERSRHHVALVEGLVSIIRKDPGSMESALKQLGTVASSMEEQLRYQELQSDRLAAEGKWYDAFAGLLSLREKVASATERQPESGGGQPNGQPDQGSFFVPSTPRVTRTDLKQVSSRFDVWLSGRLQDIWTASSKEERQRIDDVIGELAKSAVADDAAKQPLKGPTGVQEAPKSIDFTPADAKFPENTRTDRWPHQVAVSVRSTPVAASISSRRAFARLFAFHPTGWHVAESVADDLAAADDLSGAQLELVRLAEMTDESSAATAIRARAIDRLGRLLDQFGFPDDADHFYGRLATEFGQVDLGSIPNSDSVLAAHRDLGDSQSVAQRVAELKGQGRLVGRTPTRQEPAWAGKPWKLERAAPQQVFPSQEVFISSPLPFFKNVQVEIGQQDQRMRFESIASGAILWQPPLRFAVRNQGDGQNVTEAIGHQLVIVHRDVLHVFSPIERRLLWSRSLDGVAESSPSWRYQGRRSRQPMVSNETEPGMQRPVLNAAQHTGRLAVVQPTYITIYGRRAIVTLDPQTGEELWRKEGLPQFSQVVGNAEVVVVMPTDASQAQAFRARDGKPLELPAVGTLVSRAMQLHGSSVVVVEEGIDKRSWVDWVMKTRRFQSILRSHDPVQGRDRWKIEYPPLTRFTSLDSRTLMAVPDDGKVELIDAATGSRRALGPIPPEDMKGRRGEMYALSDSDRIYLLNNETDMTPNMNVYGDNLSTVRAHGKVYAWSKDDGTRQWRADVKNQMLVTDKFSSLPVLVFMTKSRSNMRGNAVRNFNNLTDLSLLVLNKASGENRQEFTTITPYISFIGLSYDPSQPLIEFKSYNQRLRLVTTEPEIAQVKPPETKP